MIRVLQRAPGSPLIFLIDGKPYDAHGAAEKLGMKLRTLHKRKERGTDFAKPVQPRGRFFGL